MRILSSLIVLLMAGTLQANVIDFNTPGDLTSSFTGNGMTELSTGGILNSGSIVGPRTGIQFNTLRDTALHTPGTPLEVSVFFKYDLQTVDAENDGVGISLMLQGADYNEFTILNGQTFDDKFHYFIGNTQNYFGTGSAFTLADDHWYKAGLQLVTTDNQGNYALQAFIQDFGVTGTTAGALVLNVGYRLYDPEILNDSEFIVHLNSESESGVSNIDNFTYNGPISNIPLPTYEFDTIGNEPANLVVYNYAATGFTYNAGKKIRYKRTGYAVVDLNNNLCTFIGTFTSGKKRVYAIEDKDGTTWFNVQASKTAEFTVASFIRSNVDAPRTDLEFMSLKGKNVTLLPGSVMLPKSLSGVSRAMYSEAEYLEETNVLLTFNKADTVKVTTDGLDRDTAVEFLTARLAAKGYAQ